MPVRRFLALLLSVAIFVIQAPAATSIFTVQTSPSPSVHGDTLNAVTAASAADAWAVGFKNSNNLNGARTLAMHWNGLQWSAIPSPNPGTTLACAGLNTGNVLNAVASISHNDVWAVGFYFSCNTLLLPLILHWNGTAWKKVSSPTLNTNDNAALNGVIAVAWNDVYAVGYQPASNGAVLTLVEHWDGVNWSVLPSPNASATGNVLSGVSANSATDIWAVGDSVDAPTTSIQTLVEHFDGTSWKVVPSPNVLKKSFLNQNVLLSVTALSTTDVTAAGWVGNPGTQTTTTLIERWNGTKWAVVPSPNQSTALGSVNEFRSVTALSSSDMYAVGFYADAATSGQHVTLVEHFNGSGWSIIPSPTPLLAQELNGTFALGSTSDVWIVGADSPYGIDFEFGFLQVPKTLVLFTNGG